MADFDDLLGLPIVTDPSLDLGEIHLVDGRPGYVEIHGTEEPMAGWIGVDLDGTLAEYHGWTADNQIGKPVGPMLKRVKKWLSEGKDVRIVTARVAHREGREDQVRQIERWCEEHVGQKLPVTNQKDFGMIELWDDRAVEVQKNRGLPVNLQRRHD